MPEAPVHAPAVAAVQDGADVDGAAVDPVPLEQQRAHVAVRALYGSAPAGLWLHWVGAAMTVGLMWPRLPLRELAWWLLLLVLACAARGWVLRCYRARLMGPMPVAHGGAAAPRLLCQARRAWDASVLAGVCVWAVAVGLFFVTGDTALRLLLLVITSGLCVAQPVSHYATFGAALLIGMGSLAAAVAAEGLPSAPRILVVLALTSLVTLAVGWRYRLASDERVMAQCRALELADRLQCQTQAAEQARTLAEDMARLRTRFFTAASHDLRQPLHALGLFTKALQGTPHAPDTALVVQRVADSVDALQDMFDEWLDLTRIEQGSRAPQMRPVPLAALAERVGRDAHALAFDKGLSLRFVGMARSVWADAALLERVLRNLVVNAVHYTQDGGVLVSCRARAGGWLLQVWDTGPGLAADDLPRLFDPYWRGDAGRLRAGGEGLGLGLAIAHGLSGAMGMRLSVRSTPGRGTVFSLWMQPAAPDDDVAPRLQALQSLAGRRVAMDAAWAGADAQAGVLSNWLRDWGAEVVALPARGPAPDAALAIVPADALPGAEQDALDARVRAWHVLMGDVPLIVLDTRGTLAASGAVDPATPARAVLAHPLQPARLRALVEHLLRHAAAG